MNKVLKFSPHWQVGGGGGGVGRREAKGAVVLSKAGMPPMPHAPQRKVAACRGSDPGRSTFVLPENDVLVDKVAQRSVHGLHAPHVKLPRHCHQPLPRRRRRGRVQYCSERVKPSRRRPAMLPGYCPTQRYAAPLPADGFAASGAGCLMSR